MASFDEISKKGNTKEILKEANSIIELEFNPWKDHVKEEEFSDELEGKDNPTQVSIEPFQITLINDDESEADNESTYYCNIVIYICYKGISDAVEMENKNRELVDKIIKLKVEFEAFRKILVFNYLQLYQLAANSFEYSRRIEILSNEYEIPKRVEYQWKNKRKKEL
jgi:hypothetical protein